MSNEIVSLNLDSNIVRPIIEKKIQAAIIKELGGSDELVEKMVALSLSKKVNEDGNVGRYSSDNKFDFIEAICGKAIRDAANAAMKEWSVKNAEKVKNAVIKELAKPNRQRQMAKAFADTVENSIKCHWRMKCNISFAAEEEK
jgi:hypothetical protein